MTQVEVSTQIAAAPEQVWELIGDPTRMGEWSPECRELAWLGGVSAPGVGARFTGRNRNGWRRWTTRCTIVRHEPGRDIAWDVSLFGAPVARWAYRIEVRESDSTCRLVEVFQDRRSRVSAPLLSLARGVKDVEAHNRASMQHTLAQIKSAAEGTRPSCA